MKRNRRFNLGIIIAVLMISLLMFFIFGGCDKAEELTNEELFINNIKALEAGEQVTLKDIATFEWDEFYSFGPYQDPDKTLGFETNITPTMSEIMVSYAFLNGEEVVFDISDMPSKIGFEIRTACTGNEYKDMIFIVEKIKDRVVLREKDDLSNKTFELNIFSNTKKYSPMMSSIQGVTLTPIIENGLDEEWLNYEWKASSGSFHGYDLKEGIVQYTEVVKIKNKGEPVLWSPFNVEEDNFSEKDIVITCTVTRICDSKIIAQDTLNIKKIDFFYEIDPSDVKIDDKYTYEIED